MTTTQHNINTLLRREEIIMDGIGKGAYYGNMLVSKKRELDGIREELRMKRGAQ